jgi:malate synthase
MGGMAAQIPIKNDPEANNAALEKVRLDKLREVKAGHDGTWVAHPGLVGVAKAVFDEYMPRPNQIDRKREEVCVRASDLLKVPSGDITEQGLRLNIDVGIQYVEAWLRGSGAVPIYNLMEDAATAEISRAQVWQWSHYAAKLSDGRTVTPDLVRQTIQDVVGPKLKTGRFELAAKLFGDMSTADNFVEFLTIPAYQYID